MSSEILPINVLSNGLLPIKHQAITWTNSALLCIEHQGAHFSEVLFKIQTFSFKHMHIDGLVKTKVSPLLMNWRYCSLVLSHPYEIIIYKMLAMLFKGLIQYKDAILPV